MEPALHEATPDHWATRLVCSRTGEALPLDRPAFLSAAGAPLLVEYDLDPARGEQLRQALPGRPWTLWRYKELLPLADFDERVDLGEGGTPLVRLRRLSPAGDVELYIKDESLNPTGSFKARGLSLAVNRARELGAPGVQLASAGNAALALAAYAAAAGLPARLAMPEDTPASIFARCREHGAEVLASSGTLVDAAKLLPADGFWNLSTLREPYRVEGKKTMGFELAEQLGWDLPDWIVYPLGGGTGIVGMHKAFDELSRLALLKPGVRRPRFVIVQMAGCAPMVRAFERGEETAEPWADPHTRAWGLRVPRAIGDFLVLRAVRASGGRALAIAEERLAEIAARVARQEGIRTGPEGAAALAAVEDLAAAQEFRPGERVVVFQTGHPDNYL
ncbi:MAG TPA: threonine synthase [Thermoanaerobaculia bacterium]|nr:threonine synthase [Thermoanaerobaculia bacterium]